MKKTVLTFGLIPGVITGIMMFITMPCMDNIGYSTAEIIGWTTIILSFSMIFFGIRSFRENNNKGSISFGKAFTVGILITTIASLIYTLSWLVIYYNFLPAGFMEQMTAGYLEELKASGKSAEAIAQEMQMMSGYMEMFKNPFLNGLFTFFFEPFPAGLIITLISAGILRKKPAAPQTA